MTSHDATNAFRQIEVRTAEVDLAERLAAEAYAAGATGLEERECGREITLILYAPAAAADAVCDAIERAAPGVRAGPALAVPEVDWSERWKAGLTATVISPRLLIRPSFVSVDLAPGQAEVVIDPGQAFGTGGHVSTHLALEWIDELAPALKRGARVLDVGTGTGVLALAAGVLTPADLFAFDTDPLATAAARVNARANGCGDRLRLFTGGLEALADTEFDWVVANLLSSELLPILAGLAARVRAGGCAVLSGLLDIETPALRDALPKVGLRERGLRRRADANGDAWVALLTSR